MARKFITLLFSVLIGIGVARAETHTVRLNNLCGYGTPQLIQGNEVLSSGSDHTFNGPGNSLIAYLQTGPCGFNGEQCLLVEINLNNPGCPGCGSFADMSLISPHKLNVPINLSWINGCDGQGVSCSTPDCLTAYHESNNNQVLISCQTDNVGLEITFCPNGSAVPPTQPFFASNENLATQPAQTVGGVASPVAPTQTTQVSSSVSDSPNTVAGANPVASTQTTPAGSSPSAPSNTDAGASPVAQTQSAQPSSSFSAPPNTDAGASPVSPTQTTQASSSSSASPITGGGACHVAQTQTTPVSPSYSTPLSERRMMRGRRIHV